MINLNGEICPVEMESGKLCGRPILSHGRCIFHMQEKEGKKEVIFDDRFKEEFSKMQNSKDIIELDFSNFIFPNRINFKGTIFKKPTFFNNAKFIEESDFSNTEFLEEVDFSDADFIKEADFSNVKFDNGAYFSEAQFVEKANFTYSKFGKLVVFSDVDFCKEAYFSNTKFIKEAEFSWVTFYKGAYFSKAQFNYKTNFSNSIFMDEVRFIHSKFNNKSFTNFNYCQFHKPKYVRFQNNDLSNVSFLYSDITEINFLNEKWAKKNGRLSVIDESRIKNDDTITYDTVAQLYRILRRNYEVNYRFEEAGNFFIGEMEMLRLDVSARFSNKILKMIELWLRRNFSLIGIYKYLSLYGESYFRPTIWAFIIIISYPLLIHWWFNTTSIITVEDFVYIDLRNSFASFFQIGNTYVIERMIGIPILGLLFIALKRKFERKK